MELCDKVDELIKKYNCQHLTIWGASTRTTDSGFPSSILLCLYSSRLVKRLGFLSDTCVEFCRFCPSSYLELPTLLKETDSTFIRPCPPGSWKRWLVHTVFRFLATRRTVYEHAKLRGIRMISWVWGTLLEYQDAFNMGAQGIMTDFQSRLAAFLQDPSSPPPQLQLRADPR